MKSAEAAMLDCKGTLYVDIDGDCAVYGVFGSESAHCYATFATEEEAREWVKEELELWSK
ncbi:MAG: hypothetical protein E4G90_12145 [Gemmatimonadales bacterium]|nr:MAG: hypothetical protein E4G90_12145 [Gemmatimonadales bacterium]